MTTTRLNAIASGVSPWIRAGQVALLVIAAAVPVLGAMVGFEFGAKTRVALVPFVNPGTGAGMTTVGLAGRF
jgi:hypothetical protein